MRLRNQSSLANLVDYTIALLLKESKIKYGEKAESEKNGNLNPFRTPLMQQKLRVCQLRSYMFSVQKVYGSMRLKKN